MGSGEQVETMNLKRLLYLVLLTTVIAVTPVLAQADRPDRPAMTIIETLVKDDGATIQVYAIPPKDDSNKNGDYKLLGFHWYTTASYWINPSNNYGFTASVVIKAITASAETWDGETKSAVFKYLGSTSRQAGRYDGYNVVAWGNYRVGVIAVTYIWYIGDRIVETDTRMNTRYKWSISGEAGKMDVRNIMTHEFGHWCGLDDLYDDKDYWLTMYGYADYGETYKRTLGLGDINGLEAVYGP
jgi:hypothetical protein